MWGEFEDGAPSSSDQPPSVGVGGRPKADGAAPKQPVRGGATASTNEQETEEASPADLLFPAAAASASKSSQCPPSSGSGCSVGATSPALSYLLRTLSSHPQVFFCSQQLDEADLTEPENQALGERVFRQNPEAFLRRFGRYLRPFEVSELAKLVDVSEETEEEDQPPLVAWLEQQKASRLLRRNRRYRALQTMLSEGHEYFSEAAMRRRDPYLHEQLIGRHLTNQERALAERADRADCTLSNIILNHMDLDLERQTKKQQRERDNLVEFDEDEQDEQIEQGEHIEQDEQVKQRLREEFAKTMYQSFLDGKDLDFDYARVDDDEANDDLETMDQDAEDRYFDED